MENVTVQFYPTQRTPKIDFLIESVKPLPKKYKLPKPNKTGSINRGQLKKLVAAGVMLAKCDYIMTDDYAWDASIDCGRTGWLEASLQDRHGARIDGTLAFTAWDFATSCGCAYLDQKDPTLVHLIIHGNESHTFKMKAGV